MAIEKLDFEKVSLEKIPYTLVSTKVIQNIKNPLAGFIWIYLSSLPPDWKVNKEQIKHKFDLGDDKIKAIFSYLNRCSLIRYDRERDEAGKLGIVVVTVLCGDNYKIDEPYQLTTGVKTTLVDSTTGVKATRVENHTCGFRALQKKYNNKDKKKIKKTRGENGEDCSPPFSLSLCNFIPPERTHDYCKKWGIDMDYELQSFKHYAEHQQKAGNKKWENNQIEFQWERWLQRSAKKISDKF